MDTYPIQYSNFWFSGNFRKGYYILWYQLSKLANDGKIGYPKSETRSASQKNVNKPNHPA